MKGNMTKEAKNALNKQIEANQMDSKLLEGTLETIYYANQMGAITPHETNSLLTKLFRFMGANDK